MSNTRWTKEQIDAIESRNCNLLVAAAAGSGKTAVLVERIIKMVTDKDDSVDIDKLLVVTFTSAAASEMRERISKAIEKELEKSSNNKQLQKQLSLLSRANIMTIHSFCLDVIKNYFYTIDLDPSFRICDETEGILLRNEVIDEIFEKLYEEDNNEFKDLLEAYGGSKDDEKLKEIILGLYKFCMSGPFPKEWLKHSASKFNLENLEDLEKSNWIKIIKNDIKIEVNSCIDNIKSAITIIESNSELDPYKETFYSDLETLENIILNLDSFENIYNALNYIKFGRLKTIKKSEITDLDSQELVKNLRDNVKSKIKKINEDILSFTPEESLQALKNVYPYMKTLSEITISFIDKFSDKKREKNILDFNDLEHLCLKVLLGEDKKPTKVALYFKEYFKEVLVDEYQDSNKVQETIVGLVSKREEESPNVFMVGDIKQSIYRFRQAKPELFLDKYKNYNSDKNKVIQLYKNFRSREEVINGINFIFENLMSEDIGELNYNESEKLNLGANYPKLDCKIDDENILCSKNIELHILDKTNESKENYKEEFLNDYEDKELDLVKEEEENIDDITSEAIIVAKRINKLIDSGFKVFDKDINDYRKIKYKDIVILLRATKNWAETFLDTIGSFDIPIYADIGSGYFESIEIRTIMSLLKVIDNPIQDIPMISLLRSPIVGFSVDELSDLRLLEKDMHFYEIIQNVISGKFIINDNIKEKCMKFNNDLIKWREKSIYTPIDEFIWYLYKDTSYFGFVGAMPNGKLRHANLKILFQRAKVFESSSFKGVFNFINFINKLKKSSGDMGSAKILSENEDVVRIMSIHKSKGLEFPVVFCSGMGKQFNLMDLNNSIIYHEELGFGPQYIDLKLRNSYTTLAKESIKKKVKLESLSEEMRILYVAFTRAKEKLIISGATNKLEKSLKNCILSRNMDNQKISSGEIIKLKTFLDWIFIALSKHKQSFLLEGIYKNKKVLLESDKSNWEIELYNKSDLILKELEEDIKENEESLEILNLSKDDIDEEVKRRLDFVYKYKESSYIPSNISVSEIKRNSILDQENEEVVNIYKKEDVIIPKFMQGKKPLTSAQRGTIVHYVMQRLDLSKVNNINEIKSQVQNLILNEALTHEEASVIYYKKILDFYNSDLGKRLIQSYKNNLLVQRELPFFTEIDSIDFKENLDINIYKDEKIRIQGIIDLFFEENDEIILVDYKTDFVEENKESEVVKKYEIQLKYYKNALEKITGKRVKESWIYLFNLGKNIKIEI